jgi:hypothetical protein
VRCQGPRSRGMVRRVCPTNADREFQVGGSRRRGASGYVRAAHEGPERCMAVRANGGQGRGWGPCTEIALWSTGANWHVAWSMGRVRGETLWREKPARGRQIVGSAGRSLSCSCLGRGAAGRGAAAWDVYTSYYYRIPYALINFELAQPVHPHPLDRSTAR